MPELKTYKALARIGWEDRLYLPGDVVEMPDDYGSYYVGEGVLKEAPNAELTPPATPESAAAPVSSPPPAMTPAPTPPPAQPKPANPSPPPASSTPTPEPSPTPEKA